MKTKRILITVLTVALLISAALIVSCASPGDGMSAGPKETKESNFKAPPGKGIVRLNVSDKNARTILPNGSSFPIEDMWFKVAFVSATPGNSANDFLFPSTGTLIYDDIIGTPILATFDEYHITITAYNDAAQTIPIAGWSSGAPGYEGPYEIDASPSDTTVNANLVAFGNGASDGYFEYSITIPDEDFDYKKLEITRYSSAVSGFPAPVEIELNPAAPVVSPTNYNLPSGYYTVTVTLKKAHYQTIYYGYALHIYPAMTSSLILDVSGDPLVQNEFELNFDVTGVSISNPAGTFDSKYVGYAKLLSDTGIVPTPSPSASTTSFDGWANNASGAVLTLTNERMPGTRTLYAKFTPGGSSQPNGLTITFNFSDPASTVPGGTISRNSFSTVSTITLTLPTLPLASNASWKSGATWKTGDTAVDYDIANTHQSGNDVVINNSVSYYPLLAGNGFDITVFAEIEGSTDATVPNGFYSKTVHITVVN